MKEEYNNPNRLIQNRNTQNGLNPNQMNQNRNTQNGLNPNQMNQNRNTQNGLNLNQNRVTQNQIPREKNLPVPKKEKNSVFKRIFSLFLAGVVGFGIGVGVGRKDTEELSKEPKTEETGNTNLEQGENIDYWETIKVETPTISETKQEKLSEEAIKLIEGIDDIDSSQDTLNWFKELYVSQYQGDKNLEADDISFVQSSHSYIIKAGDKYVTHGSNPDITQNKIANDGLNMGFINDVDVYSISIKSTGEVIDCGAAIIENGKKQYIQLIPGDSYGEINEDNLILGSLNEIPESVMKTYSLYVENSSGNGYIESLITGEKQKLEDAVKGLDRNGVLENSGVEQDNDEIENLI